MFENRFEFDIQPNSTLDMLDTVVNDTSNAYTEWLRTGTVLTLGLVSETIANPLLLAIIHYEKFGMDPKKRTAINQLVSNLCAFLIFFNLVYVPFWMYSLAFRGLAAIPVIWLSIGLIVLAMYPVFIACEVVAMKCFYALFWSRASGLNDDFMARFLILFNIVYSFGVAIIRILLGDYHSHKVARYLECPTCPAENHPKFFILMTAYSTWFPDFICLMVVLVGSVALALQKIKTKKVLLKSFILRTNETSVEEIQPTQNQTLNFNNAAQNDPIVNFKASFGLLLIIIIFCFPAFLTNVLKMASGDFIMNYLYFNYCILVTVLPALHFLVNPSQFRRVKEDIFEA